ncbi:MAG: lysylphosphatidylglycerol synthase domain-containing protein [Planctomycetota bacterium]
MKRPALRYVVGPIFALVLFGLAVRLLFQEAKKISWEEFQSQLLSVPPTFLCFAALLILMNYVLLIAYDMLALRYICRSLPLRRVALASFLGFSLGNNLGTLLAGTPLRFRFYGRWGIPAGQITALIAVIGLTFWSGLWFLGGCVLTLSPIELPPDLADKIAVGTRSLGIILLAAALAYLVACVLWKKPLPIGGVKLRLPEPGLMVVQASVAAVDLFISATALYLVLPAGVEVSFALVLAAYLCAIAVSLLTQMPGGLGILEAIILNLLKGSVDDTASILASLFLFRCLYYFAPLLVGMVVLLGHEIYGGTLDAKRLQQEETRGLGNPSG